MRWPVAAVIPVLVLGCRDTISPELPPLVVRIIAPTSGDTLYEADSVLLVGHVTADDIGVVPGDSVWWTDHETTIGQGSDAWRFVTAGSHVFRLHARYNSREDSATLQKDVAPGGIGRVLWTLPLDSNYWDGVALGPSGLLFATSSENALSQEIFCISLEGSILWRASLPPWFSVLGSGPAIGPDGMIYYGYVGPDFSPGGRGGVVAFTRDGALKWIFDAGVHGPSNNGHYHVFAGAALGADGAAYFGVEADDAPLYAVNPDGTLRWRTATSGALFSSEYHTHAVVLDDSLVLAIETRDSLVAVSAVDGTVRWKVHLARARASTEQQAPAIGRDGTVYVARGSTFVAVRPDGTVLWRRHVGEMRAGSPTVGSDRLFLAAPNGGVTAYSLNGDSVAAFGAPHTSYNGVVTLGANGVSYVAATDTLYSYEVSGRLRFATPVPHRQASVFAQGGPVIAPNGTVYLRASLLGVIAIRDTVGPATDAPWPTFQGGPMRQGRRAP